MSLNNPYSNFDISHLINDNIPVWDIVKLKANNVADLFKDDSYAIVFYNNPNSPIGHWVACIKLDNDTIEIFNPAGTRSGYSLYDKKLKNLFLKSGYLVVFNKVNLQDGPESQTCGRWVAARILGRHTPLNDWLQLFKKKGVKPDEMIMKLIAVSK